LLEKYEALPARSKDSAASPKKKNHVIGMHFAYLNAYSLKHLRLGLIKSRCIRFFAVF